MSQSLRWLPNAISILRIVLIIPVLLLIRDERFDIALLLFFIAGFSDGVDGYLAKRFEWHSRLGALLDPVADKLLMAGTYITLAVSGQVPIWMAGIVVFRDVVIIGGATAYNFLIRPVEGEPTRILSRAAFDWTDPISGSVIGAAVLVSVVISGVDYVVSWARRAESRINSK